ncbi:MAG TPA: hypothetical protein VEL03_06065 [Streptosporangiaceae bacterium]|nr:hypothetical protein [Streptosporangiaceae bacterium]
MADAAQGTGDEQLAQHAATEVLSPAHAVLAGLRQPIVLILLLIAFFTTISGKPLDGFLMLTVATLLVWDAARTRLSGPSPDVAGYGSPGQQSDAAGIGSPGPATAATSQAGQRERRRITGRMVAAGGAWLASGLLYAGIVGGFRRYSWPATIGVVSLGCLMVAVGWQGPLRRRAALTGQALRRAWLWAVVLVAGGMWELSSLLQQPHLTTDSYAHPTISALTDPLLASHPGRSLTLGAWLLIGWFLVGR